MAKIKAVLFDMDGVLIDAKDWHYEALNKALGLFGMTISRYDHLVTYDGLPTKKKLQMLTLERGLPTGLHEFINDIKQQYTMEIVYARCKPRFQHQYALAQLKKAGYRIAVCSNSIRQSIEIMMEKAALSEYLSCIVSNEEITHPKPDPEGYLKCMQELGLQPEECLILEDNEKGIRAALASGGHLMRIDTVEDVHLQAIMDSIEQAEHSTRRPQ